MEELIKALPAEALVALGAVIGLGLLVRYFGLMQGQRAGPEHSSNAAQVAAVIVDPTALNQLTAALEAQTMESIHSRKSFERGIEALCRTLERLCEEVDDLKKEMIRRGR
ncbi:hypothetical protein [Rhizobium sp. Root483D2]|uniref:hypothetical protein n=1 Tax=Rhizobium sp. Root483D2 TaxID=1736545 RepID=UPI00071405B4|nr:hypothetical protein [Rhizobium sp. Root483D2]KQY31816.1 hypothetical protein ASD32_04300 [Rhizobium sp. Root483D2]